MKKKISDINNNYCTFINIHWLYRTFKDIK